MTNRAYPHIMEKLRLLYGEQAPDVLAGMLEIVGTAQPLRAPLAISEQDIMLITYGDMVRRAGEAPLRTLRRFLDDTLRPAVNCVHILPFYPYSSDDGFSVIDYFEVNPDLGTWDDIVAFTNNYRLMFDGVFNHISQHSKWFQNFLRGVPPYTGYFTVVDDPTIDLSAVVRPRTLPLLYPFDTAAGTKYVWCTFSRDQVDLNFANPRVLLEVMLALLFYVRMGANFIRLDAIAFIWKEIGTDCIHRPQTHAIVQLLRDALDIAAPSTILITETNVPHAENISYFGAGNNEAQMVYNFALPPLALHTLRTGDASALTAWAATLKRPGDRATFFNFTASHDGIGVRPVTGILEQEEIDALVTLALEHGGRVSSRTLPDGSQSPYELNISYFDAITHPDITARDPDTAVARFMVSQSIALTLMGMPGIYFHSLFGSRNHTVKEPPRAINRAKLDADALRAELRDETSIRHKVYGRYLTLLNARRQEPAFHPLGGQRVLDAGPALFALERIPPGGGVPVLAVHNVTGAPASFPLPKGQWRDLITGQRCAGGAPLTLAPYQIAWLKRAN